LYIEGSSEGETPLKALVMYTDLVYLGLSTSKYPIIYNFQYQERIPPSIPCEDTNFIKTPSLGEKNHVISPDVYLAPDTLFRSKYLRRARGSQPAKLKGQMLVAARKD
jgi:hypothetical protein